MTKDQDAQMRIKTETEDQALLKFLSTTFHNYSLAKLDPCFSCESLALQDYHN